MLAVKCYLVCRFARVLCVNIPKVEGLWRCYMLFFFLKLLNGVMCQGYKDIKAHEGVICY